MIVPAALVRWCRPTSEEPYGPSWTSDRRDHIPSPEERATLGALGAPHKSSQALALRCRIVLGCADGLTHAEIARQMWRTPVTVGKWRHRFATDRLDRLIDAPRPGAARTISDEVVEAVVVDTLESAPADATHWSTRGLAAKHGISHTTVGEHLAGLWAQAVASGLLQGVARPGADREDPLPRGVVHEPAGEGGGFTVDEKPQIQALNRTAPTLPMLPTTPARATHDYERNGTCDLFAALEVATGKVITDIRSPIPAPIWSPS